MKDRPGIQFLPANGNEGYGFIENHCKHCARDRAIREGLPVEDCDDDELCAIIAASFCSEAVEWRRMADGRTLCTAYVPVGEPIPPPKDEVTVDMFDSETDAERRARKAREWAAEARKVIGAKPK